MDPPPSTPAHMQALFYEDCSATCIPETLLRATQLRTLRLLGNTRWAQGAGVAGGAVDPSTFSVRSCQYRGAAMPCPAQLPVPLALGGPLCLWLASL